MKTIDRRIRKLEVGAGIIETEGSRREREFEETIRRRINEGRARLGLPPRTFTDSERRELAGMSVEEILQRGRAPEHTLALGTNMPSRSLTRRLDRLETEIAPPSDKPGLTIIVTGPGETDEVIEVRGTELTGRRRTWQRNGGRER